MLALWNGGPTPQSRHQMRDKTAIFNTFGCFIKLSLAFDGSKIRYLK